MALRNDDIDAATIALSTAKEPARLCGAEAGSELGMALLNAKALLDAATATARAMPP